MRANGSLEPRSDKVRLNLGIVGGSKLSTFFLNLANSKDLPFFIFNIVGVCDPNPEAEGIVQARKMGIYTTTDFRDLFDVDNLDGLVELTDNRDVLLEIVRLMPKGIWVIDHNGVRIFQGLYSMNQQLRFKEQEARLEKTVTEFLMEQANERIVLLSPDFTIIEANEAYLKAVNMPRKEIIGKHCYEITHGLTSPCSEWEPEMGCPLVETLRTGKSAHVIHEHMGEHGRITYCDLETYPAKNDAGEVVRVVEIWRDITEELASRWEHRLNKLKSNLGKMAQEDRIVSLGKLSASCVHEINNPIQGLLTFSRLVESMLSEGNPNAEDLDQIRGYLAIMSRELERCGAIISGLLSFSRESVMAFRTLDLNQVLAAVISLTRHKMQLQDIRLEQNLSKEPLNIDGDVSQLQQCFLNLIFNAIEAMPQGGCLDISSEREAAGKRARVTVRDTGCGIPVENRDKIFDPFFTTKPEGEGTGLGLSIVYGIVKGHLGEIRVDSEPDRGTGFTLSFPLQDSRPGL